MPPAETKPLLALLKNLLDSEEAMLYRRFLVMDWGDAAWVGNRLAEILPLPLPIKQALLMVNDPIQRLNVLQAVLKKHRIL
jgi:Lon protease-like protein